MGNPARKRLARRSVTGNLARAAHANWGCGELMRRLLSIIRPLRGVLLFLMAVSYFGSLWGGALHFPHGYDWRRNVISNLLSPRDNPGWYWLPSLGVAVTGLCMLLLAIWMESELDDGETTLARRVRRPAFFTGIACLVLAALIVPQHQHLVMGLRHAHELLARTAAVGLGAGMLSACLSPLGDASRGDRARRLRILRTIWLGITTPPILGAIGSGLMVACTRFHLLGDGLAQFFHGTLFWYLAFWEWAGSASVFLFFASAVALLGRPPSGSTE